MDIKFVPDENKKEYEYALSACLCGVKCRYDGKDNEVTEVKRLYDENKAIIICPEVMGGLSTPRHPCELTGSKVINNCGENKTEEFSKGAEAALEICKKYKVKRAILKQNSPSCGSKMIYDGTFTSVKIPGQGVTAKLLSENGIEVLDERFISDKH